MSRCDAAKTILERADAAFENDDYDLARNLYRNAQTMRAGDYRVGARLAICDASRNTTESPTLEAAGRDMTAAIAAAHQDLGDGIAYEQFCIQEAMLLVIPAISDVEDNQRETARIVSEQQRALSHAKAIQAEGACMDAVKQELRSKYEAWTDAKRQLDARTESSLLALARVMRAIVDPIQEPAAYVAHMLPFLADVARQMHVLAATHELDTAASEFEQVRRMIADLQSVCADPSPEEPTPPKLEAAYIAFQALGPER